MPPYRLTPGFLAVDFYCGAGGATRGLIDAGAYVIAGIDKDPVCRDTYQRNNRNRFLNRAEPEFIQKDMLPRSPNYPDGRQHEILAELQELIPRRQYQSPNIPLLFAVCPPCQSFTKFVQPNMTAERTAARARDRSLLAQALTFIHKFSPDMILSENVAGIDHGTHGALWSHFQNELRRLGYRVGASEVNASRFAVPQRRRRAIILAAKSASPERAFMNLPVPAGSDANPPTVKEAIGSLPPILPNQQDSSIPNHQSRNLSEINRRRLNAVAPGQPNFGFNDELALPCHRRLDVKGKRGFGDVYTRIHPDRPAPTITTRFHSVSNGRFGHYDENQARGLSLREGALLQSFPQDYEFLADGMDAIARMIGNAVPPLLARRMAEHLYNEWRNEHSDK